MRKKQDDKDTNRIGSDSGHSHPPFASDSFDSSTKNVDQAFEDELTFEPVKAERVTSDGKANRSPSTHDNDRSDSAPLLRRPQLRFTEDSPADEATELSTAGGSTESSAVEPTELPATKPTELSVNKRIKQSNNEPIEFPSVESFNILSEDLDDEPSASSETAAVDADPSDSDSEIKSETPEDDSPAALKTRPPRSRIVRTSANVNPLESAEIQANSQMIRTPVPRVDELLPKRVAAETNWTQSDSDEKCGNRKTTQARAQKKNASKQAKASESKQSKSAESKASAQNRTNTRTELLSGTRRFISGRVAGILLLASACFELLLILVWASIPDGFYGLDKAGFSGSMIATALTQIFLVLIPSVAVTRIFKIKSEHIQGQGEMSFSLGLLSFMLGIPAGLFLHSANNILMYMLTRLDILVPEANLPGMVIPNEISAWPLLIVVTVLAPAVFEELMFRGIILPHMASSGYHRSALLLSAVGFAIFHDDPLFWLAPFGAGLILGLMRMKSDTIYSSMLTHTSMNLSILLVSRYLPAFSSQSILSMGRQSSDFFLANLILLIVMGLVLMPMFVLLNNITDDDIELFEENGHLKKGSVRKRVFFIAKDSPTTDFTKVKRSGLMQANPYTDVFYWLACIILLTYLLSHYFVV